MKNWSLPSPEGSAAGRLPTELARQIAQFVENARARRENRTNSVAEGSDQFLIDQLKKPKIAKFMKNILRLRRLRQTRYPDTQIPDPAWDIVLDLYWAGMAGQKIRESNACMRATVSPTIALRRIDRLVKAGVVDRSRNGANGRHMFLTLGDHAASIMDEWISGADFGLAS